MLENTEGVIKKDSPEKLATSKLQGMNAEVIVKLDKLVRLQIGLNDKNMFEGDLV
jgi:hypothetical protein